MKGNRNQRTSQLAIVENMDSHPMQDFVPAGRQDAAKPQINGGEPHAHEIPAKSSVDDTAVQMDDGNNLPPRAKNGPNDSDDFQTKLWKQIDNVTPDWRKISESDKNLLRRIIGAVLCVMYFAYLIYISIRDVQEARTMLVLTGLCVVGFIFVVIRDNFGETIREKLCKPLWKLFQEMWATGKWIIMVIIVLCIGVAVYFLTTPKQLMSAVGLVVFILLMYVFSKSSRQVKWRPVLWGLFLQFILGIFILRTNLGFNIFEMLGCTIQNFLDFSDAGAKFVFGDAYSANSFAFKVLPVIIYFSAVVCILYHLGIMQILIRKLAWLMQNTMKTSAPESLNAVANIFFGQTEAPLLIRPLLKDMTNSELHAVMTGGFATIAGSVLFAYISFGVSASHLLTASVMSAPAALAISKLFYPETKENNNKTVDQIEFPKTEHKNIIDAASYGAYTAVPLVLNIAGNAIAFLALLAVLNGLLGYFGGLAGIPELSFEWICSYLFIPFAFLMGVDFQDCGEVARLIGLKTFVNEFFAYEELSTLIDNRVNDMEPSLSIRSEIIATYALCGFANIGSLGILLGALNSLVPSRKKDLSKIAFRALIAGTVASFMTACVAGILYDEAAYDGGMALPNTCGRISLFPTPKSAEPISNNDFSTIATPDISTRPSITFTLKPTQTLNLNQSTTFTLIPTSTIAASPSTTFYLVATSEEALSSTRQPHHPPAHQPHHPSDDHHNQSPSSTSPSPEISTKQTSEPPQPPAHQPHHPPVDHHNQPPSSTSSPTSEISTKQTSEPSQPQAHQPHHPPVHQPHHPPVDHHNQSPSSTRPPTPEISTTQTSEPPQPPAHQPHHPPVDHHNQPPSSTSSPTSEISTKQTSEPSQPQAHQPHHPPVHQPHHPPVDHHNQSPSSTRPPTPEISTTQTSEPPQPPAHQPHHPPAHQPHHPPVHNPHH